jgi:hypothetical protein
MSFNVHPEPLSTNSSRVTSISANHLAIVGSMSAAERMTAERDLSGKTISCSI